MSSAKQTSQDPKFDELHKELFDLGIQTRREVVGNAYVDKALKGGSTEYVHESHESERDTDHFLDMQSPCRSW